MKSNDYQLINGDCLEEMKNIPDGSIDLCLTDIPYGEVNRSSNGLRNLDKGKADEITFDLYDFLTIAEFKIKGSSYIFCGTEQVSTIRSFFVEKGYSTRLCIWEKTNPSPMNGQYIWLSGIEACVFAKKSKATFNEHCKNPVWRFPTVHSKLHPTQKPIELLRYLIRTSSNENDIVADFTMGSGSTGVACMLEHRKFIGIEKDANYFEIAKQRIEEAINKQPLFATV